MSLATGVSDAIAREAEVSQLNKSDTLLTTKLTVPLPCSNLVSRDHLIAFERNCNRRNLVGFSLARRGRSCLVKHHVRA